MATYRELTYMILDELKTLSDDSFFEEEHIIFLLDKYRAFLLKQRYSDIKRFIPESNYQSVYTELVEVPAICGEPCEGGNYLRSKNKIPYFLNIGIPKVYPIDYYQGEICFVNRDRMKYIGYNKFTKNTIYCSLGPDNYLYFKSNNPQFIYLEKVKITAIFSDAARAFELRCIDENDECQIFDAEFPIEDALIPPIIELIVKELTVSLYRPEDSKNNSSDDLSKVNMVNTDNNK